MNDHQPHGGNGGFEREDLGARTIFGFLIGLAVLGILVYFAANGIYRVLNNQYAAHQGPTSPLKETAHGDRRDLQTSKVRERIENNFPQPLLENDERNELTEFRRQEEKQLNSYGWVDQKAGVVRVPIERAMQLMAERGLPVRPQGEGKPAVVKKQ